MGTIPEPDTCRLHGGLWAECRGLHYAPHDEARAALGHLVALKVGPRDDQYEAEKPFAWQRAQEVLAGIAPTQR